MNIEQVQAALAPDHHSQAAYTGRVMQTETIMIIGDDGTPYEREITFYISWDTVSKVLALVRKRSGIQP